MRKREGCQKRSGAQKLILGLSARSGLLPRVVVSRLLRRRGGLASRRRVVALSATDAVSGSRGVVVGTSFGRFGIAFGRMRDCVKFGEELGLFRSDTAVGSRDRTRFGENLRVLLRRLAVDGSANTAEDFVADDFDWRRLPLVVRAVARVLRREFVEPRAGKGQPETAPRSRTLGRLRMLIDPELKLNEESVDVLCDRGAKVVSRGRKWALAAYSKLSEHFHRAQFLRIVDDDVSIW